MPENQRISLFVNPFSEKAKVVVREIIFILDQKKIFYEEGWPDTLKNVSEAWIIGGDGTINYFLNKYNAPSLPLAFFKAGTGNDIYWRLYGEISLIDQVEAVLRAGISSVDCAGCNEKYYINSSGLGFDGEVLRSMNTIRWMGGHLGYLFVVIKKIFSFREYDFRITLGSEIIKGKYLLVAINNSSRTGGGFMVTPDASLVDGKLDILLCKPLTILQRLKYLPKVEKGKHLTLPQVEYRQVDSVRIDCEKMIYAQLDGELINGRSFVFKNFPKRLSVRVINKVT